MPFDPKIERRLFEYTAELENVLERVYSGIKFSQYDYNDDRIIVVDDVVLAEELQELAGTFIAKLVIFPTQDHLILKENYFLGNIRADPYFAYHKKQKAPRWAKDEVKSMLYQFGFRITGRQHIPINPPVRNDHPRPRIIHNEQRTNLFTQQVIYLGSQLALAEHVSIKLRRSRTEYNLREYLDFLYTLRKDAHATTSAR
jgi:hypothetical protein